MAATRRKASEKSIDDERSKNSPEEEEEAKVETKVEEVPLIEVSEKCSAIIIKRTVLTRKVLIGGEKLINHLVDGEDIVIEM